MHRINAVAGQVSGSGVSVAAAPGVGGHASAKIGQKSDNDAVICCAIRTALGKSKKGSFKVLLV